MIRFKSNLEMYQKYREVYPGDQQNLCKNFVIKFFFDLGHKFIASRTVKIPGKILDVGCGSGYHIQFEDQKRLSEYICLDIDKKTLDEIPYKEVKKIVSNCEKIPLPSKSISVVIASHVFEHLPNLDESLRELKRIMKDDGELLVVLPCDPGLIWNVLSSFSPSRARLKKDGFDYDVIMDFEHVNSFSKCLKYLKKNFKMQETKYYPLFIRNHNLNLICCMRFGKND